MRELVGATVEAYGRLDIACDNAGVELGGTHLGDVTDEQYAQVIGMNLTGVFHCMRAELEVMLGQGSGSIINMASISVDGGYLIH